MRGTLDIAAHALVYLGHKNSVVTSDELADNICTHPVRVRKIMAQLRRASMADAKEGADGGYVLTKPLSDITLADVAQTIDFQTVQMQWKSGDEHRDCYISSGMAKTMADVYASLNLLCLKELENIRLSDIELRLESLHKARGKN